VTKKRNKKGGKKRKHHNNKGFRQVQRGKTREQIRRLALELGIPFELEAE